MVSSVKALGFEEGATLREIFARAEERGLRPCPSWVGPELRLQYENQPKGEWLFIAMEPFLGSNSQISLFIVESYFTVGLWLCACRREIDFIWSGSNSFVFVLPNG